MNDASGLHADIGLLERIAAQDEGALSQLYDRHAPLLFGLILRIVRIRADAEDVLQEVFFQVWTRARSYDRTCGAPIAWLVRIGRNRAIDRLRTNRVRGRPLEPVPAAMPESPEADAARTEEQRAIVRALAELPPEQRTLIEHAFFEGHTHAELAEQFGLPLGTVKTRVRTGLIALRRALVGMASPLATEGGRHG